MISQASPCRMRWQGRGEVSRQQTGSRQHDVQCTSHIVVADLVSPCSLNPLAMTMRHKVGHTNWVALSPVERRFTPGEGFS